MHRRALLALRSSIPLAGCTVTDELALTSGQRFPPEDRLSVVSRAGEAFSVRFTLTDDEAGETRLDETRTVAPGQGFTFAEYLPRRGSVTLVVDVEGGTRFERGVGDFESFTVEIRDADTVVLTHYVVT